MKRITVLLYAFLCLTLAADAQQRLTDPLFATDGHRLYAMFPLDYRETVEFPDFGLIGGLVFSPDGSHLLVASYHDRSNWEYRLIDPQTLAVQRIEGISDAVQPPLWRWDSGALLYAVVDDGLNLMEYDLTRGRTTLRASGVTFYGTGADQRPAWWSPDGFALIRTDSLETEIWPFDNGGNRLRGIHLNVPGDSTTEARFLTVETDAGQRLAIFQPRTGSADIVDPITAEVSRLPAHLAVVEASFGITHVTRNMMSMSAGGYNIVRGDHGTARRIFTRDVEQMTLSPGGNYAAAIDENGIFIQDGMTRIDVDHPLDPTFRDEWRLAWSPLEARILGLARFDTEGDTLVIRTPDGALRMSFTGSMCVASDLDSMLWLAEGGEDTIEVWRYRWSTNKQTLLYRIPHNPADALPTLEMYDGRYFQLASGQYGGYRLDTRIYELGHSPAESNPTPFSMPLSFYQYGKFGVILTWDKDGEFIVSEGGGEAGYTPKLFSPDASFNATVITPPAVFGALVIRDSHTLDIVQTVRSTALAYDFDDASIVWRWDGTAVGYVDFTDEGRTAARFISLNATTGEIVTVFDGLPVTDGYRFPMPVMWTPDFVVMRDARDTITADMVVYDVVGQELRRTVITDLDADPDSRVLRMLPTTTGEVALFFPDKREWKLLDPATGGLHELADEEWIAEVPQTNPGGTRYGKIIAPEGGERIIELFPDSDLATVIEGTSSGLSVSPDGQYYSYLTNTALMVGGAEERLVIETQPLGIGPDSISWSPLVGRVVRILGTSGN